jgi:hypothetical protein
MTDKPFSSATPYEKLEQLFNEKALRKAAQRHGDSGTFHRFAETEANAEAGRFSAVNRATVTGAKPVPEQPMQPAEQWSNQASLVGEEAPYDGDMGTPIVGESFEVAASIAALEAAAPATETLASSPDVEVEAVSAEGERDQSETSRQAFPPAPSQGQLRSPNQTIPTSKPRGEA